MKRIRSLSKWLYPGMRMKRWLGTLFAGALTMSVGLYLLIGVNIAGFMESAARWVNRQAGSEVIVLSSALGLALLAAGFVVILYAVQRIVRSVGDVLAPDRTEGISDIVYRKRSLAHGPRIVVMGGGTGLSTMLRGLKHASSNLTAIVTVSDDGGSSGRIVRDYNVLPPGDIRNCIVALADNEGLMSDLFQHRFEGEDALAGHSLGNLLMLAMCRVTGSFDEAVRETSRVLAIRGRVLPSTLDHVRLVAELADGTRVEGETAIAEAGRRCPIRRIALDPPDVRPLAEAEEAIRMADAVIIGPGSVFTSVIPNLLVPGLARALRETSAMRVYVCNVMTQPGESDGFSAADHVRAIEDHAGKGVFHTVLANTRMPGEEARARYAAQGAEVVEPDIERIEAMGYRALAADFLDETDLVRHDPETLAAAILEVIT